MLQRQVEALRRVLLTDGVGNGNDLQSRCAEPVILVEDFQETLRKRKGRLLRAGPTERLKPYECGNDSTTAFGDDDLRDLDSGDRDGHTDEGSGCCPVRVHQFLFATSIVALHRRLSSSPLAPTSTDS